jgi:hypothetical protein
MSRKTVTYQNVYTGNCEILYVKTARHLCTLINKPLHHNTGFAVYSFSEVVNFRFMLWLIINASAQERVLLSEDGGDVSKQRLFAKEA